MIRAGGGALADSMADDTSKMALIATAKNPIPVGAHVGMLDMSRRFGRRVHVRYARWPSVLAERHGTVCILPGRAEFIEKYFEVIGELRQRGFAVATLDWRGQGGSSRLCGNALKGHVRSFDNYMSEFMRLMKDVVLPDCPPPYYLLGHSMGGAIALKVAAARGSWFDRAVLTAPMLKIQGLPCSEDLAGSIARVLQLAGFGCLAVPGGARAYRASKIFENNIVTSDPERFARNEAVLEAAPQLATGTPTLGWLAAALRVMAEIEQPKFLQSLRVPVLTFAAGNDHIVSNAAIESYVSRLRLGSEIVLRGSEHEILQERDSIRDEFWAGFDAFIPNAKSRKGAAAA